MQKSRWMVKTVKLDTLGVGSTASISTESKNNKTVAVKIAARSKMEHVVVTFGLEDPEFASYCEQRDE